MEAAHDFFKEWLYEDVYSYFVSVHASVHACWIKWFYERLCPYLVAMHPCLKEWLYPYSVAVNTCLTYISLASFLWDIGK